MGQPDDEANARLLDVLTEVLSPWAFGQHDEQKNWKSPASKTELQEAMSLDDVAEAAEYLADEIRAQDILLPEASSADESSKASSESITGMTLVELQAHPLHSLVLSTLQEMLSFSEEEATSAAPTVVEETLQALSHPSAVDDTETKEQRQRRGILGECELCERIMPMTEHHLIPRSEHDKMLRRGHFTLKEMRQRLAMLCRPCHSAIHSMIGLDELATRYNTMEALLEHEGVVKWGRYAAGLKERSIGYEGLRLKNKR